HYEKEARRMLSGDGILFPHDPPMNGDARLIEHPPGYAMILAIIMRLGINRNVGLWVIQLAGEALSAILVFFISASLLNRWIGFLAGLLVALSPQFSYYSLVLSPDSLSSMFILLSVLC